MLTKPVSINNPPKEGEVKEFLNTLSENIELIIDLLATHDILMQDMSRLLAATKGCSDSKDMDGMYFHTRSLVRSIFPYVEFAVYWFFQMCLIFEETVNRLSTKDRKVLEAFLENRKEGRMQTLEAFKFAVKCLGTAYELSNLPDFGCQEWEDFRNVTSIRDRFMHPKNKKNLMIEIEEYVMMGNGISWMMGTVNSLVEAVTVKTRVLFENTGASLDATQALSRLRDVHSLIQLVQEDKIELTDAQAWLRSTNI
jgi:hypothetical protein